MKKSPVILSELLTWVRGRFTLTEEEKRWILLVLTICWVGLIARYVHLKSQQAEPLTPQQAEQLLRSQ